MSTSETYEVTSTAFGKTETGRVTIYVDRENALAYLLRLFDATVVHEIVRLSDGVIIYLEGEVEETTSCTQRDDDGCSTHPWLGICACGYVYHDIPRATDDAHGELCGADEPFAPTMAEFAREQWVQGRDFSAMIELARMARQAAVARETGPGFASISSRAQDYGIVPHHESADCFGCKRIVRWNMQAASVLRYRLSHVRVFPNTIYGMTVTEEVLRAGC
jgi:hypothetical protein